MSPLDSQEDSLSRTPVILLLTTVLGVVVYRRALSRLASSALARGLALTLIHLISIPVTNTSVNPARSVGPAVFVGGGALAQLRLLDCANHRGHPGGMDYGVAQRSRTIKEIPVEGDRPRG